MKIQDETVQIVGNTISIGTLVSVLTGILPFIASIVALVWYVIQIKESETWRKRVAYRRQKRLAKLRAELAYLEVMSTPLPSGGHGGASAGVDAAQ